MSATALVGSMEILVPMAGLIDKDAELARLNKEIDKLQRELEKVQNKLGNENSVGKAPAEVVAKERERMADMEATLGKLSQQCTAIKGTLKPSTLNCCLRYSPDQWPPPVNPDGFHFPCSMTAGSP